MKRFLFCLLLIAACSPQDENVVNGYIEGEYVYISPYASGVLDEISVVKGQNVQVGDALFSVDKDIWETNLKHAQNELNKVYANYANLGKGKRKQELEIILKQKAQAIATLKNAEKEFERAKKLINSKTISQADYDRRLATFENVQAKVSELEATLETAMLSAREDELKAAQSDIEISTQNLLKIKKQAENNNVKAKIAGQVEDVYFRLGEYVLVGTPIIAILPPENVKIRFFVSEKILPLIKLKNEVMVECSGCQEKIPAKISFISSKSEFTPPVIYSVESREKLIFMVEAVFDNKQQNLHPGLPVSVRINGNDKTGY